jgi:hypothetical protein
VHGHDGRRTGGGAHPCNRAPPPVETGRDRQRAYAASTASCQDGSTTPAGLARTADRLTSASHGGSCSLAVTSLPANRHFLCLRWRVVCRETRSVMHPSDRAQCETRQTRPRMPFPTRAIADRVAPNFSSAVVADPRDASALQAQGTPQSPDDCIRETASARAAAAAALALDDSRASETRTGSRPLTRGETEARRRARVSVVRRPNPGVWCSVRDARVR